MAGDSLAPFASAHRAVPPLSPPDELPADLLAEVGWLRWRAGRLLMQDSAPPNLVSGQDVVGGIDTQIAQRGVVPVAFVADERASYAVSGTVEGGFPSLNYCCP